jgi:hypothetical protein
MKKNLFLSQVLFFCLLGKMAIGQEVQPPGASISDWRQDTDDIVNRIRALHPNPFLKTGELTFLREVEAMKAALPSLTEEQRVVRAMRLVALLGDGHTQLEPDNPAFAFWYPIRLYEFTDGFFVTSAHKSVADLAGAQVLEIAGRPVEEAVAEVRTLMGADNRFGSMERLYAVHSAGLMKGLGFAAPNGQLRVKFKLGNGKFVVRDLAARKADNSHYETFEASFEWQFRGEMFGMPLGTPEEWVSAYKGLAAEAFRTVDMSRPPHLIQRGKYISHPMPEQDAYYVQVNQVDDTSFVTFFQRFMQEVDQLMPRRLILDWRYNFGGDGSKVSDMIHELVKREDNKPWNELYLLTGRKTHSAAIMALDAFLKHTQFTIVGEPTGSALNHFGDAVSRNYPRTGLKLDVSTLRHQLGASNDLSEFLPVDVPAPFSFADYVAGRDPAVDPILRGEEMRSLPVIALMDGGATVREVYEMRKRQFAKYHWWAPPREIDLRRVCDALREQKRMADAVETCKLNAEIHPDVWNVWYNLGIVQRAAGLKKEALESYRRVLEIDPDNWNAPAIRRLLAAESRP